MANRPAKLWLAVGIETWVGISPRQSLVNLVNVMTFNDKAYVEML